MAISWDTPNNTESSGGINWGTPAQPTQSAQPQQSFSEKLWNGLADVSHGAAKGAISGIAQTGSLLASGGGLIEKGLDNTIGRAANIVTGKGNVPTNTAAGARQGASDLNEVSTLPAYTPNNTAENIGSGIGQVADALVTPPGGKVAKVGGELASQGINAVKSPIRTGLNAVAQDSADIKAIQESIAPKMTAKETKLALSEGRIVPGQEPGLLRNGTPDTVLPSAKQAQAAITIRDNIQGAAKMKPPELFSALDKKISEFSEGLKPVMEITPIRFHTLEQINKDWKILKEKQLSDPYLPSGANIEKLQQNFETNYLQKTKTDNMADLWETRKAYDASVPANVKSATINSSDSLQAQKSIWLQNRSVLNDAIHGASDGLGELSQKTFQEMSHLYEAQKGIQSSYKIMNEVAPSRFMKVLKSPVTKGVVGGAGALELGKKIITGEF